MDVVLLRQGPRLTSIIKWARETDYVLLTQTACLLNMCPSSNFYQYVAGGAWLDLPSNSNHTFLVAFVSPPIIEVASVIISSEGSALILESD